MYAIDGIIKDEIKNAFHMLPNFQITCLEGRILGESFRSECKSIKFARMQQNRFFYVSARELVEE